MKKLFCVVALSSSVASFAAPVSEKDRVLKFLTDNVAEASVVMAKPVVTKVFRDKTPYSMEYSRSIKFSKFTPTKTGMYFDAESNVEYLFKKAVRGAKPAEKPELLKRRIVHRLELGERKSTDDVLGFIRVLEDSDETSTGDAYTLSAEILEDGSLELKDTQIMFSDESLNEGKDVFPGATASTTVISLNKKGKLVVDQAFLFYEVDPIDFLRIPFKQANGQDMNPVHVLSLEE